MKSEADIVFFGGAAGGGKTFLLLGAAGTQHRRSIIFRREYKQLEDIREKAERMYGEIGTFNGQRELWRLTHDGTKRRVRFGAMQLPGDEQAYQGQQQDLFCVGAGTPVFMADGSRVAIENISLGDFVQTLEGPRRVTRLIPKRREEGFCVVIYNAEGRPVGHQVQSRQHKLLTTSGWVGHDKSDVSRHDDSCASTRCYARQLSCGLCSLQPQSYGLPPAPCASHLPQSSAPERPPSGRRHGLPASSCDELLFYSEPWISTVSRICDISGLPTSRRCRVLQRHLVCQYSDLRHTPTFAREGLRRQDWQEISALSGRPASGTGYEWSGSECQEDLLPPLGCYLYPKERSLPVPLSGRLGSIPFLVGDDGGGRSLSSPQCLMDDYSAYTHPYGGPPPQSPGPYFEPVDDRHYPPLLVYAAPPNPNHFEVDALGDTPIYSSYGHRYPHPYRSETRLTSVDLKAARWDCFPCGEVDLYDIEVDEVNHYISGPGLISKNCFDEITHFQESQFRFVTGWNRSDVPGQRSRVIAAGNPPTNAEGYWVIKYWAPWLDPKYPKPAKDGELRWFAQIRDKYNRMSDLEVDGPGEITIPGEKYPVKPRSRTFIRALLTDNPVYMASGYMSVLQGMPEPLRSQMLHGDFLVGHEDHPRQVIPTEWVLMAQKRWYPKEFLDKRQRLDTLGVDVARGGKDSMVITPRYGTWFDEQKIYPGSETPDGFASLQLVVDAIPQGERPNINIDVIGVGSAVFDLAKGSGLSAFAMDARQTSFARDSSGALGFARKKSEWWWKMREALDPNLGDDLALPPDRELLADLTAPRYEMKLNGIQVEDKDDLMARIGRSPDRGDSCVLAHAQSALPIATHLL